MKETTDFAAIADGLDDLREALCAMVAGLTADGFTDREARAIVAGMIAHAANKQQEEQ